jgi:hypothetical protein
VLEIDDLVDRPLDLDVVPVFELVGAYQGESVFLEPDLDLVDSSSLDRGIAVEA